MSMTLLIMLLCDRATVMDISLTRFTGHLFKSISIHLFRMNYYGS